jgi:hypothetical protein
MGWRDYQLSARLVDVVPEDSHGPIGSEKNQPALSCHICGESAWWLSKYGVLRCGVCHPPAHRPDLVKEWIGDPETLTRLKTSKPAVILSWEERRCRKAAKTA